MTRQEPASGKCPICNLVQGQKLIDWKEFEILKCRQCRLIYCFPIPTDDYLENFYQGFLFKPPLPVEIEKKVGKKVKDLQKLFHLWDVEACKSHSFLDYGGGVGTAYCAAINLGLSAYYFDLDTAAIEFAQRTFGLNNEHIINKLEDSTQQFDYILSDNVIEHVRDPVQFVYQLANRLVEGGTLIIKTPHGANSEVYLNPFILIREYIFKAFKYNSFLKVFGASMKGFWHCDPPRHLYSFSRLSLEIIMKKLQASDFEYRISYYQIPWFAHTITHQFFSRDKKLSLLNSILVRLIIWPVIPIEAVLQVLRKLLLSLKLLTPGGIILEIKRR